MHDGKAKRDRMARCAAIYFGATLLVPSAGGAAAAEREHAAHVHGVGKLNIAVEEEAVEIELLSPGADIVGFEHAPETAEDKAAVKDAAAALMDGASLFAYPAEARCRLEEAEVESALLDHDHGEHGEEEHGEEEEAHAEFHAHYHFHCARPDSLTHVDVKFFERFPAAEELEVQAISPRGQSAGELTPSAARLKF